MIKANDVKEILSKNILADIFANDKGRGKSILCGNLVPSK